MSLLRFSAAKLATPDYPLYPGYDKLEKTEAIQDLTLLDRSAPSFSRVPIHLAPRFNLNLSSRITCYEDLKIIKEYEEREKIYGKIYSQGKMFNVKIEIITFCMNKFIIFKAHK